MTPDDTELLRRILGSMMSSPYQRRAVIALDRLEQKIGGIREATILVCAEVVRLYCGSSAESVVLELLEADDD